MELEKIRHSAAHILAGVVKELFPEVKLGTGPAIDEGFYYDLYRKDSFKEEDLKKIEERMKRIIKEDLKFKKFRATRKEAEKLLKDEPFKLEILKELKDDEITFN
jgi:threonyl-tRNA synthetase